MTKDILAENSDDEGTATPADSFSVKKKWNRRDWLRGLLSLTMTTTTILSSHPQPAFARGLVQFPYEPNQPLFNTYHFMRAGVSLYEEQDIWSTNPLFLTSREDALSTAGQEQVVAATTQKLKSLQRQPTVVVYSLAASCMDTANIVQRELGMGRDRLYPEFTFLDPRAIGRWDMMSKSETEEAVWAMDVDEAGPEGLGGRPPPHQDGTPHETLADQAIRLRQLFSGLETRFSGDTILLVFPDGTGPAVLSALLAGIPLNRAHELEFAPGELRLDVTVKSTLELWKEKQTHLESYQATIKKGRARLKELRALAEKETATGESTLMSLKDQKMEEERLQVEAAYQEKKRLEAIRKEEEKQARLERQREMMQLRNQENGGDMSLFSNPVVLAGAAAAVGGVALTVGSTERFGNDADTNQAPSSAGSGAALAMAAAGGGSGTFGGRGATNTTMEAATAALQEQQSRPTLYTGGDGVGVDSRTTTTTTIRPNGDSKPTLFSTPLPQEKEDPHVAAKRAMEEYMNSDDGGEAWLETMAQIMREEDDDDDVDDGETVLENGRGEKANDSSNEKNGKDNDKPEGGLQPPPSAFE